MRKKTKNAERWMDDYVPPTGVFVGRSAATAKLYRSEADRNDAIRAAGRELGKVLGHSEEEFWSRTMPEELRSVLDSFSPRMVRVVVEAWLEKNPRKQDE